MDIFTHALLPYLLGSYLRMNKKLLAAFVLGGIAPDLDLLVIWINSIYPTSLLIVHRGFTHTFFFGFFTALVVLYLASRGPVKAAIQRFVDFDVDFSAQALAFAYAGILSHLFLDFLTTRGVPLLYPLEETRFSAEIYYHTEAIVLVGSLLILAWLIREKRSRQRQFRGALSGGSSETSGSSGVPSQSSSTEIFNKKMFIIFVVFLLIVGAVRIDGKEAARSLFKNESAEVYPDSNLLLWVALENYSDRFQVYEFNTVSGRVQQSYAFPKLSEQTNGEPQSGDGGLAEAIRTAESLPQVKLFRWRAYAVATNASMQNGSWHLEFYDPVVREEMMNAWPILQIAVRSYSSVQVAVNVTADDGSKDKIAVK
jgi:inner membrane protein